MPAAFAAASAAFSPSQTTTYLACPMKHYLSRTEGWRPRVLSKRDVAAIVGQAFAAGIAAHNQDRRDGFRFDMPEDSPASVATHEASVRIDEILAAGCTVPAVLQADVDFAPTQAARAVERVCADDPIPADWTIVDVERPFPDHGNARPDLVCRGQGGDSRTNPHGGEMVTLDMKGPSGGAAYALLFSLNFGKITLPSPRIVLDILPPYTFLAVDYLDASGEADFSFKVPMNPAYSGIKLLFQTVTDDTAGTGLYLVSLHETVTVELSEEGGEDMVVLEWA